MTLWKTLVSSLGGETTRPGGTRESRALKPSDFRNPQRLKDGYLWCESMIMPRPCTIKDMSPLTAKVDIWQDDIKPHLLARPMKLFSSADQKEADCVLAGRNGTELSLRFTSPFRAPTRKYA
jgi:hypothetical protein